MVKRRQQDASKQVLLLLVVAVLVVSLVGTWMVLQSGFSESSASSTGQISFNKVGSARGPILEGNTRESGVISFVKQG